MTPPASANPAKPRSSKAPTAPSTPPEQPPAGVDTVSPTPPAPILDQDGSYSFLYTIDPPTVKRLLTRTYRPDREEMEKALPRYVETIVKRAIDTEVW